MKNSQKSFAPIALIIILVILAGGGYFLLSQKSKVESQKEEAKIEQNVVAETQEQTPTAKVESQAVMEETADWKTYRNEEYGFEFRYPQNWEVNQCESQCVKNLNFDFLHISNIEAIALARKSKYPEPPSLIDIGIKKTNKDLISWLNLWNGGASEIINNPLELDHLRPDSAIQFQGWGRYGESVGGNAYAFRKKDFNFFISPENFDHNTIVKGILSTFKFTPLQLPPK